MATLDRLKFEHDQMTKLIENSNFISFTHNSQLNEYTVKFTCNGLTIKNQRPVISAEHAVKITLTVDFPHKVPEFEWLTDIFHPNIKKPKVCILGKAWYPTRHLDDICIQLGEMIQYKNYNIKPREYLDQDAKIYVEHHRHSNEFPIDTRPLLKVSYKTEDYIFQEPIIFQDDENNQ